MHHGDEVGMFIPALNSTHFKARTFDFARNSDKFPTPHQQELAVLTMADHWWWRDLNKASVAKYMNTHVPTRQVRSLQSDSNVLAMTHSARVYNDTTPDRSAYTQQQHAHPEVYLCETSLEFWVLPNWTSSAGMITRVHPGKNRLVWGTGNHQPMSPCFRKRKLLPLGTNHRSTFSKKLGQDFCTSHAKGTSTGHWTTKDAGNLG
ncbi:hypothetical protein BaRGS_00023603 [Batillaria attramentaria]|uniref:Uncharacterized protein n=1 Tax=Batillaria attramentaria TaxID=370345 RepID=A0ABD0KDN7_9CAEN